MGDLVDLEINKNSGSGFIYLLLFVNFKELFYPKSALSRNG